MSNLNSPPDVNRPKFGWEMSSSTTEIGVPSKSITVYELKVKITNLYLPDSPFCDMDKLQSSVRTSVRDKKGSDFVGLFPPNGPKSIIFGTFFPNFAECDGTAEDIQRIYDDFREQTDFFIKSFEETINAWILDSTNGYTAYCEYIEECKQDGAEVDLDYCDEMFDKFLFALGLKTEESEKKKAKARARAKKATKPRPRK